MVVLERFLGDVDTTKFQFHCELELNVREPQQLLFREGMKSELKTEVSLNERIKHLKSSDEHTNKYTSFFSLFLVFILFEYVQ